MENFGQELKAQVEGDHCHNLEDVGSNRVTKKKNGGRTKNRGGLSFYQR